MTATAKRCTAKSPFCLRVVSMLALVLVPAVLAAGCSKATSTSTTTAAVTSTTAPPTTSSTSTTEATTTTTAPAFPPTVSHEQNESRFIYAGTWKTVSSSSASGGSLVQADSSGCSLSVRFYGTGVSWIAEKGPGFGEAKVTVDGGKAQTIDLYASSAAWKKKIWKSGPLAMGDHTLTIVWTGTKNKSATAATINVDAVVVAGVLTRACEQDSSALKYGGTWKTTKNSSASAGSYVQADSSGSTVTIRFTGIHLVWLARVGPGYGQAKVTVDGGAPATVDLFSASTAWKKHVWDTGVLPLKTHTVKIQWSGTKSSSATGTAIDVDAFDVTGVLK